MVQRFAPETKRALRTAAMPELPRSLFDRPKAGFVLPIESWCRSGLGAEVEATLLDTGACERVGLDAGSVARLWAAFKTRSPGIYWSRVWALFVLAWWARRHDVGVS
jgi:asparagine synthase (glutamine-hydrolysing)